LVKTINEPHLNEADELFACRSPIKPEYQILITPIASEQIKKQLEKRGTPDGCLRLGLTTGCSGFAYAIQFEDNDPRPRDLIFHFADIKVVVDPKSIIILDGCTLDYERTLLKSGFIFHNPKEKSKCGCGSSFTT